MTGRLIISKNEPKFAVPWESVQQDGLATRFCSPKNAVAG
jgi:hypothetical protein